MLNISSIKVAKPRKLPTYGTGAFHTEQQFCFELGHKEGIAAARKAIREALNGLRFKDDLVTLMNSCAEGYTGEWECSTQEGREGFVAMYDHLSKIAARLNIDVSEAKDYE